ncbi:hypothetical protein X975_18172, partial [Stegodyphus mimosarum]
MPSERKRKSEDDMDNGSNKERKTNGNFYSADTNTIDNVKTAFKNGTKEVKIVLKGLETGIPIGKLLKKGSILNDITDKEDDIHITRGEKIIISTKRIKTVEKVCKLKSLEGVGVKASIIEDTYTTKHVVKNVDTQLSLEDIAAGLEESEIKFSCIIRFTKPRSDVKVPIILIKELGSCNRSDIKIGRINFAEKIFPSKGGGLAIFVLNNLPALKLPETEIESDMEVLGIKVHIYGKTFTIVNCYRPSAKFKLEDSMILDSFKDPSTILVGDFNGRHKNFGDNITSPSGQKLMNWIIDSNMIILNNKKPTHIYRGREGGILDLCIANANIAPKLSFQRLEDTDQSDHFPVYLNFNHNFNKRPGKIKRFTNWRDVGIALLRSLVSHADNMEETVNDYTSSIVSAIKTHTREITYKVEPKNPWFNLECAKLKQLGDNLKRRALRSLNPSDWVKYKGENTKYKR